MVRYSSGGVTVPGDHVLPHRRIKLVYNEIVRQLSTNNRLLRNVGNSFSFASLNEGRCLLAPRHPSGSTAVRMSMIIVPYSGASRNAPTLIIPWMLVMNHMLFVAA